MADETIRIERGDMSDDACVGARSATASVVIRTLTSVLVLMALALCVTVACQEDNAQPEGLAQAPLSEGPRVIFDLDAEPLPEIPFPNDVATRLDETSPTGRRVNISLIAPTELESDLRGHASRLDGFGTYSPLYVSFDAPLDIELLIERHRDDDPANDPVFLLNVDPDSEGFGERVDLDMGDGNFPLLLRDPDNYFPNDPRAGESNLLFETVDEDLNRDDELQPWEDTDGDGVLDKPNLLPGGTDPWTDLMTFYERETNTLIVRPVVPLREQTTYAVVLTKYLEGTDGWPVRSPFAWINHTRQNDVLAPLPDVLSEHDLGLEHVAFAWSFTTQSVTLDLEVIRRGLYGHGPMAWLAETYPADVALLDRFTESDVEAPHLLEGDTLREVLDLVGPMIAGGDPQDFQALVDSYEFVDYIVSGTATSPYFIGDRDGLATPDNPQDDDELFDLDPLTGEAHHEPDEVPWTCVIPKREYAPDPDGTFPVVFYGHGYGSSRFEILGFAGSFARHGLATCGIDAAAHGLMLPSNIAENNLILSLLDQYDVERLFDVILRGRARDLDNDGDIDSAGDFWTANTFHTRDVVRQSIVDHMQVIRVFRGFDGTRTWRLDTSEGSHGAPAPSSLAGDFDGDGRIDIGGPDQDFYAWGCSLGGILSAILVAVEPAVTAAAPHAGGGGLSDIAMRSTQGGVPEAVWLRVMGPLVLAEPDEDGGTNLSWYITDVVSEQRLTFANLGPDELAPGDRMRVTNLDSGEWEEIRIDDERRARMGVAGDAMSATEKRARLDLDPDSEDGPMVVDGETALRLGDPYRIEILPPLGETPKRVVDTWELEEPLPWQGIAYAPGAPLVTPGEGFGQLRQSPELRRFFSIAQVILEPADPANYAARYQRPIDYSDIEPERSMIRRVLNVPTVGDMNVPINTGLSIARAAGYLETDAIDERYGKSTNQFLIDNYVYEAIASLERFGPEVGEVLFDPDDLDRSMDEMGAPVPTAPLRTTVTLGDGSKAGMRLPYMNRTGQHGFATPSPSKPFDIDTFMHNQIAHYFSTRGREIVDDVCLEDSSCDFIPPLPDAGR